MKNLKADLENVIQLNGKSPKVKKKKKNELYNFFPLINELNILYIFGGV